MINWGIVGPGNIANKFARKTETLRDEVVSVAFFISKNYNWYIQKL